MNAGACAIDGGMSTQFIPATGPSPHLKKHPVYALFHTSRRKFMNKPFERGDNEGGDTLIPAHYRYRGI